MNVNIELITNTPSNEIKPYPKCLIKKPAMADIGTVKNIIVNRYPPF